MFKVQNFENNDDVTMTMQKGCFSVLEYNKDLSCTPASAIVAYFSSEMNVKQRVVCCDLAGNSVILQPGEMQWTVGNVNATTGIKGVGDFFGKALKGSVTGESAIKPEYTGNGRLILEPTWRHIILLDVAEWGGNVVLDDGIFKACDGTLKHTINARKNFSSAVAGGEGLFNLALKGQGIACLESDFPEAELVVVELQNDVLKVDGNLALAWTGSLDFTTERSGKSLIGSAASGEGLVNVYRGTGKVLMCPFGQKSGLC